MAMPKLNKTQLPALISFVIIFASYIGEKALKRLTPWSATSAILQAIALTAAVLAVFLLLLKCKDYFAGLLVSILAFKILPPNLQMLHDTAFDAAAVFFLVRKAALAMFLYLAYYFYQQLKKEQPDNYAHVWGIASILLIFPYITSVATDYEKYIMLAQQQLPAGFEISELRVEYRKEAKLGDTIISFVKAADEQVTVVLADEDKRPYAVVKFLRKPVPDKK